MKRKKIWRVFDGDRNIMYFTDDEHYVARLIREGFTVLRAVA